MKKPKPFVPKQPSPKMWEAEEDCVKKRSMKQETRLAKELDLKPTINSGSLPMVWQKEDAFNEDFQVQMKTTKGRDARIVDRKTLKILTERAYLLGRDPLVLLSFENVEGCMPEDWALIPVEVLKGLMKC